MNEFTPGFEFYLPMVPNITSWKELVLVAGSTPKDLTKLDEGSYKFERYEWRSFIENSHSDQLEGRKPFFGDYTTRNPNYSPRVEKFSPSPSLRYTTPNGCTIYRGKRTKNQSRSSQYKKHANEIIISEEYPGRFFCYGDAYIYEVAHGNRIPGGPVQWIQASEIHHITLMNKLISDMEIIHPIEITKNQ